MLSQTAERQNEVSYSRNLKLGLKQPIIYHKTSIQVVSIIADIKLLPADQVG